MLKENNSQNSTFISRIQKHKFQLDEKILEEAKNRVFVGNFFNGKYILEYIKDGINDKSLFSAIGPKVKGYSKGFFAEDSSKNILMVKEGLKRPVELAKGNSNNKQNLEFLSESDLLAEEERCDVLREYITAGLYREILGSKAPEIILISLSKEESRICIGSYFISGFRNLKDKYNKDSRVYKQLPNFKVLNFENVIMTSIFAGDPDFSPTNVGVVIEDDKMVFAKVDHGKAATRFYKSERDIREELKYRVVDKWAYKNITEFNLDRAIISLDNILGVTKRRLHDLISKQFSNLGQENIEIGRIYTSYQVGDRAGTINQNCYHNFANNEEARVFFTKKFQGQLLVLRNLRDTLNIIKKIDNKDQAWFNNQWLSDVAGQDVLNWAFKNNITIEGLDAVGFAIKNNCLINERDPIEFFLDAHKDQNKAKLFKEIYLDRAADAKKYQDWIDYINIRTIGLLSLPDSFSIKNIKQIKSSSEIITNPDERIESLKNILDQPKESLFRYGVMCVGIAIKNIIKVFNTQKIQNINIVPTTTAFVEREPQRTTNNEPRIPNNHSFMLDVKNRRMESVVNVQR